MEEATVWNESQLRKYDIPLESIPKYSFDDPMVMKLIMENKPVVISGSKLVSSAVGKWDIDFLSKQMTNCYCNVVFSKNHEFKYYDKKTLKKDTNSKFVPPTRQVNLKISEFASKLKEWKPSDERVYLQQPLESTVGVEMLQDFLKFDWDWLRSVQKTMSWGPLTSNLLLVSMEANVTPCHYDEQQNLFAQIRGFKRFILFSPEHYECLYPYPVHHPHDRQSQVDFENPDLTKFPRFNEAKGQEAVLGPGDVLYIPIYWWHYVESIMKGGYTISVNFWHKSASADKIEYPLKGYQKLTILRNVEKMLLEVLKDPDEVGPLLRAMVIGRYSE